MASNQDGGTPEWISRRFLSALAEGRWDAVADLILPESAERLRAQLVYVTRRVAYPPPAHDSSDTAFPSPLQLLHLDGVDALQSLPARELLVRWIRALHPTTRESGDREVGLPPRIQNVFLGCRELTPTRAETRYRAEWYTGDGRRLADHDREQTLALARSGGGWQIEDFDPAGAGDGHLLVTDDHWQRFKEAVSGT